MSAVPLNVGTFPVELRREIAKSLGPTDLGNLASVSKKCHSMMQDSKIWERAGSVIGVKPYPDYKSAIQNARSNNDHMLLALYHSDKKEVAAIKDPLVLGPKLENNQALLKRLAEINRFLLTWLDIGSKVTVNDSELEQTVNGKKITIHREIVLQRKIREYLKKEGSTNRILQPYNDLMERLRDNSFMDPIERDALKMFPMNDIGCVINPNEHYFGSDFFPLTVLRSLGMKHIGKDNLDNLYKIDTSRGDLEIFTLLVKQLLKSSRPDQEKKEFLQMVLTILCSEFNLGYDFNIPFIQVVLDTNLVEPREMDFRVAIANIANRKFPSTVLEELLKFRKFNKKEILKYVEFARNCREIFQKPHTAGLEIFDEVPKLVDKCDALHAEKDLKSAAEGQGMAVAKGSSMKQPWKIEGEEIVLDSVEKWLKCLQKIYRLGTFKKALHECMRCDLLSPEEKRTLLKELLHFSIDKRSYEEWKMVLLIGEAGRKVSFPTLLTTLQFYKTQHINIFRAAVTDMDTDKRPVVLAALRYASEQDKKALLDQIAEWESEPAQDFNYEYLKWKIKIWVSLDPEVNPSDVEKIFDAREPVGILHTVKAVPVLPPPPPTPTLPAPEPIPAHHSPMEYAPPFTVEFSTSTIYSGMEYVPPITTAKVTPLAAPSPSLVAVMPTSTPSQDPTPTTILPAEPSKPTTCCTIL